MFKNEQLRVSGLDESSTASPILWMGLTHVSLTVNLISKNTFD